MEFETRVKSLLEQFAFADNLFQVDKVTVFFCSPVDTFVCVHDFLGLTSVMPESYLR